MKTKNKKKRIAPAFKSFYPVLIMILCLFMGVGYAAVNSVNLTIAGDIVAMELDDVVVVFYGEFLKRSKIYKLVDKYGENGYLKLWIPHSQNAVQLAELRKIIANPTLLRDYFEAIFAEELN